MPSTVPGPKRAAGASGVAGALQKLVSSYRQNTPPRFKLIDAFLVFLLVTGVAQFVYCVLLSDYPFNSFVAGFAATVGQFVLAMALRIQAETKGAERRAFGEFLLASVVLHFFVVNFLG